jgi:hypothetical protein
MARPPAVFDLSWQCCLYGNASQVSTRSAACWHKQRNRTEHSLGAGRADYYGALPNLAARVSALAAPGQILVEGSAGFRREPAWEHREDGWLLLPRPDGGPKGTSYANVPVELEQLGFYLLKVSCSCCLAHVSTHASLCAEGYVIAF